MLKFYKCPHCGNLIAMIKDSSVVPVCCGDQMMELKAGVSAIKQGFSSAFTNWNKSGGKVLDGLTKRRLVVPHENDSLEAALSRFMPWYNPLLEEEDY